MFVKMRIGGLVSGMDTEQIIKDLMRAERMPMDKLAQQKQSIEWQRDQYRELNTIMAKFRDNIFDTVMRSAKMSAKSVTSSNESLITATASAAASNGSFTISRVGQLATAATNASQIALSTGEKIDPSKGLYLQRSLFKANENVIPENDTFNWKKGTVEKENFTLTTEQNSVTLEKNNFVNETDLKEAMSVKVDGKAYTVVTDPVQVLAEGEVRLNLDTGELDFETQLSSNTKISVTYVTDSVENYFTSSINTYNADGEEVKETFAFSGEKSLDQVFSEINSSSVGVSMFYDEFSDKVTAQSKETGNFNTLVNGGNEMIFEGSFLTTVMTLGQANEQGGVNAQFTINGLDTERQSNQFTISGVTFTLKDTFETGSVNLNVNTDTDSVFDTVVGFIDEYNKMLESVNGKLTEEHYRDFKPLTDEQKEAMSEKDIEAWEEKATSGLLRRDSTLSGGMDRLRTNIYNPVSGNSDNANVRQLTDLGITTSKNYMDRGKLEINEDKLKAAIETDPEGVFQLFAADGPTTADKGIARRMRDSLQNTMQSVSERAGGSFGKIQNHQFTLGRNIADIDSRVSNFERRLEQVEDRYWKQFTAMETAMQQANAQSANLMSMLNGGNQQQ